MINRRDLAFPTRPGVTGRHADADEHLQDMMSQVLFTLPGERLELPEFGAGVQRLVFAPIGADAAHAVQFAVQAQLQRWLGQRIQVASVRVVTLDNQLSIEIHYTRVGSDESRVARFVL